MTLTPTNWHPLIQTARDQMEDPSTMTDKMEAIYALSAGIAHEINTPMQYVSDNIEFIYDSMERIAAVVGSYEELLTCDEPIPWDERRDKVQTAIEEYNRVRVEVEEAVGESRHGIQRIVEIVRAMRTFSHPCEGSRGEVNLNEAIQTTCTISRNRWKYSAVIHFDLEEGLPLVPGFPAELNQVLLNLVVNASDAVAQRYGDVQQGVIKIKTRHVDGEVVMEIEDNGDGIPAAIHHKVFDQFFTTKEVGEGTGQGLAISYNIVVTMHGGRLSFESEEGAGTTFRVCLPLEVRDS